MKSMTLRTVLRDWTSLTRLRANQPVTATPSSRRRLDGVQVMLIREHCDARERLRREFWVVYFQKRE